MKKVYKKFSVCAVSRLVATDFTYAPEAPSPLDLPQQLANGMLFGTIRFKIASANHVVCREWMAKNGPRLIDDDHHTII